MCALLTCNASDAHDFQGYHGAGAVVGARSGGPGIEVAADHDYFLFELWIVSRISAMVSRSQFRGPWELRFPLHLLVTETWLEHPIDAS